MDFADYHPAPHVLDHVRQTDFVAVIGPTAAGKTTLIKAAVARQPALHMLVSYTSRPPRAGEQDGVDFHFRSKQELAERAKKQEYATLVAGATGDLYATAPENYPAGRTSVMAVLAHGVPLFRSLPYNGFRTIYILPPDYATWQKRLQRHGFDAEQLARRLQEARQSLAFALKDEAAQFIVNDDLAAAVEDFTSLALGRRPDARRQAQHSRGRELAGELLASIVE